MQSGNKEITIAAAPSVTVIIPTYNSARFLPESLECVLNQTFRDFEILVVDDGSTDNTEQAIAPYLGQIRYIKKENGGPAAARNLGISEARGEFIAFLDADDLWMPDKLELQISRMNEHPEFGVVFTDDAIFDETGITRKSLKDQFVISTGNVFDKLLTDHFICMSSVMIRRKCLEQIGVFDETLIGAEDYNLFLRLASRYKFGFVNKVVVHKRDHGGNLSENLEQMCHDEVWNLNKIAEMFPDRQIPTRKLIGQIYLRFGKYHFSRQEFAAARRILLKSLRRSPLVAEAWLFLAVSSLPPQLRKSILAIRKRRRSAIQLSNEAGT